MQSFTFMHQHPLKIFHRDIKPANIMIALDKEVKVCDLGLAKVNALNSQLLTTRGKQTAPGTPIYMAPEVYLNFKDTNEYTDVWSLGCTLVELFSERKLWKSNVTNSRFNLESLLRNKQFYL